MSANDSKSFHRVIDMKRSNGVQRVTMQDIARETGYSINTVSHALRNKDDIARETRERIQKVAREMGYMGNAIASSLRSGRTRVIAVILGNMSNPFYAIMADTLQDIAAALDYSLLILCSRDRPDLEEQMVEAAVSRRVDGILLFPANESLRTVDRLRSLGIPFVLMSRALGDGIADSVVCDEVQGAYLAVNHLIQHGRKKLGFLAMQRIVYSYDRRLEGFNRACDEAGIPKADRHIHITYEPTLHEPPSQEWHACLVHQLLRWREENVDGLFVFCDSEAWEVQSTLQQTAELMDWNAGIVSFDNIQGTQHFPFGLCSVDCNFSEMARRGIDLLRSRIHGDDRPPQSVVCPVHFICRGSCKRL